MGRYCPACVPFFGDVQAGKRATRLDVFRRSHEQDYRIRLARECKGIGKRRPADLPIFVSRQAETGMQVGLTLEEAVNNFKKEFIALNLKHTVGNRSRAAEIMGIQRTCLSRLISKYNLRDF
jgi:DNA-binding NtrC family response regulator